MNAVSGGATVVAFCVMTSDLFQYICAELGK